MVEVLIGVFLGALVAALPLFVVLLHQKDERRAIRRDAIRQVEDLTDKLMTVRGYREFAERPTKETSDDDGQVPEDPDWRHF